MGSDQSTQLPAGAPGSTLKSQRDEEIPYTSFSISKPIDGGMWNLKNGKFKSLRAVKG